ncbi:chromosome segregation ATPase [Vibrio ishigakensis]|uniref:Chromosome segregation ATPase n=1 Tax=Vibrio ishigakensis TaxID=1481914 RepID=A0A0B8P3K9_9VIBR|nr:chromosome segregation ATPase [Vibrio ishigakensis]
MNKYTVIALALSATLTGCGSDDSSDAPIDQGNNLPDIPPIVTSPTDGQFIDAAVSGLAYTTSSGGVGVTDTEGGFEFAPNDTITFYLGGTSGLKIGAASSRDILTPFEATGSYRRASNLAIILQSLDRQFGSQGDEVLTVPEKLQSVQDTEISELLSELSLDQDYEEISAFLNNVGVDSENIVTVDDALFHMEESFEALQRGIEEDNPFSVQDGRKLRQISVTHFETALGHTYVHADKLLSEELFEKTRGLSHVDLQLNTDTAVELAGSNDYELSGNDAEEYLNCLIVGGNFADNICDKTTIPRDSLEELFNYLILHADHAKEEDETLAYEELEKWMPFKVENTVQLNHYTAKQLINDTDIGEAHAWQQETVAGAYDPITEVYSQIREKTEFPRGIDCSDGNCEPVRVTESVSFTYLIPDSGVDRYVDFVGEWEDTQICRDGQTARMVFEFDDDGVSIRGSECNRDGTAVDIGNEAFSYDALSAMDYWWFNQTDRESKATLTELNSVVRFCDKDGYTPGEVCPKSDEYLVKFEYQPAGVNWDQGLLVRSKFTRTGELVSQSTLQKSF